MRVYRLLNEMPFKYLHVLMILLVVLAFILSVAIEQLSGPLPKVFYLLRVVVVILCFVVAPVHFKRFLRWHRGEKK